MKETGEVIINLSLVPVYVEADWYAAYHANKGAMLNMARTLALELASRTSERTPGPYWVDAHCSDEAIALSADLATIRAAADSSHALGYTARPEGIAQAAIFLTSDRHLSSPERRSSPTAGS